MNVQLSSKIEEIVPVLKKRSTDMSLWIIRDLQKEDINELYIRLWNEHKIRYYYIEYNDKNNNLSFTRVKRITKKNYGDYQDMIRMENIYKWNHIQNIIGKRSDIVYEEESLIYEVYKVMKG